MILWPLRLCADTTPLGSWATFSHVELAEEVCQDVLLVVWNKSAQFQSLAPLSSWIFGIAHRLVRKTRSRRGNSANEVSPMAETDTEAESPEACLCRQSHQYGVAQAVAALPPVLRQTITLRYYHDYTYQEIAARMGCAEATVKDRLRQAKRCLAATLRHPEREPRYAMAM